MKIPKSIKIGGRTYSIEISNDLNDKAPEPSMAVVNHMKQQIFIDKDLIPEQRETALLHEILHAISTNYSLDFEEETIRRLESALYQVLKDNKLHF
jgi:hypothetical protein